MIIMEIMISSSYSLQQFSSDVNVGSGHIGRWGQTWKISAWVLFPPDDDHADDSGDDNDDIDSYDDDDDDDDDDNDQVFLPCC